MTVRRMARGATILVLLCTFRVKGQELGIPFVVKEQTDVPVVLSGSVVSSQTPAEGLRYSYKVKLSATNRSRGAILLMITRVDVPASAISSEEATNVVAPGGRQLTRIYDYCFQPYVLDPGATEDSEDFLPPFSGVPAGTRLDLTHKEVASTDVVFVQFTDGATWGDEKEARAALVDRQHSLDRLRFLLDTYQSKGEQEFVEELKKPSELLPILSLQQTYRSTQDVGAVFKQLTTMLQRAAVHLSGLRNPA